MKLHPRLTAEGVLLARRGERFRPVAEPEGGGWVIGYGHRASARQGARVTEADALALLTYDLSQSAGRTEAVLARPASPELFDALNACARRVGPEAFARSEVLRRVNAGEAVTPAEAAAASGGAEAAPSAVALAAEAVRDRLAQVLAEPEPPAPRPPREPWREPAPAARDVEATLPLLAEPDVSDFDAAAVAPRTEDAPPEVAAPSAPTSASTSTTSDAQVEEPPPPPFVSTPPSAPLPFVAAPADPVGPSEPPHALAQAPDASPAPPPPVVSFERGGRARLWERVRADPYVYLAVGVCGLVLFGCALLGFLLGRPTASGFALGVVGVVCMAPALAFFLHRRVGG